MPEILPTVKDWQALTLNVRRNLQPNLLSGLTGIDTDLGLYAQAFSAMAKRNVAADLYVKAKALSDLWPRVRVGEKAPQVLVKLIEQAREAVEKTGGTTTRQFDDAVCIGYRIKLSNFSLSKGTWVVAYKGAVDDQADMLLRCRNMKTAIAEAYDAYQARYPPPPASSGLRPPDRTLRIFMAPEFYFRGRNGAYSDQVAGQVLFQMRQETNKPKYKNWLFVLGTVIMATFVEATVCPRCGVKLEKNWTTRTDNFTRTINPSTGRSTLSCKACNVVGKLEKVGATIDNWAIVQKGGETGEDNSYTVAKEYVSRVDFKRVVLPSKSGGHALPDWDANPHNREIVVMGRTTQALPTDGSRDLSARPIGSKFLDERMGSGGSVFEIDGIRFGLEVCLDHALNRLTGNERVSIQLVPSCGMSWKAYKCVPGGLYFGVDANTPTCQVGLNGPGGPINSGYMPCSVGGDLVVYDPTPIV
jgi:hypothetical protein